MNTATRATPAPESYATFWEPIPLDAPRDTAPTRTPGDAYGEFVNQTEDTPVSLSVNRIDV